MLLYLLWSPDGDSSSGKQNRRTKRPIAPSFQHYYPKIVDENGTRASFTFFFFFSLLSAKERKLFLMNTETETKETERKKELKFIQRYYEMHRRRSPWINPCSRNFTADRSRMNASFPQNGSGRSRWSTGWNATRKYGVWTNESPNAPRIIAPLLIQIRERASSSSSSPPRRRAYCNTSFENSHYWVPHPWGACSRVTLVT